MEIQRKPGWGIRFLEIILLAVIMFYSMGSTIAYAASVEDMQELVETTTEAATEAEQSNTADDVAKWIPSKVKIKGAYLVSKTSIKITWEKVLKADGYYIYRLQDSGNLEKIKTIKDNAVIGYTDTGLKYGKTYKYVVRAYKKQGGEIFLSRYDENGFAKKLKVKSKYKNGYKYYYDMDGSRIDDVESFIGKKDSYLIKVNIEQNVVTIYAKDGKKGYTIPVKAYLCSGNTNDRLGTFTLGARYRYRDLFYGCFSQWTLVIHGNILFHTVPYNKRGNPNSLDVEEYNKLGTSASHGCIRLQCKAVKWIYDNCKSGTKVIFYKSKSPGALGKPQLEKIPSWHTWDPTDPTMQYKCKEKKCNHK